MMMCTPLVYAGGVGESEPSGSNSLSAKHDSTVTLQEVSVRANFANEQVTPLNLTTITPQSLRIHTTAPNYVEVMQGVPGVYATSTSGSYGDASLKIRGFKQTHQPSPWINDYGQFAIMPIVGTPEFDQDKRASWFSHKGEVAKAYYYKVYLAEHDIVTELTPTERAAMFRFTFPEHEHSYVVIDAWVKCSYV